VRLRANYPVSGPGADVRLHAR